MIRLQVANLEMRIKELTEQNLRLKDKVVEARESSKKLQEDLIKSQQRCSEIEKCNDGNEVMRRHHHKKASRRKRGARQRNACFEKAPGTF